MESKPRPIVVANWKCNGVKGSIFSLVTGWKTHTFAHEVECYIACPCIYIPFLQSILMCPKFSVAAQNCVPTPGAFTGEVCVDQLKDCRVDTVIIGHSERRKHYAESEKIIGEKCRACVAVGMRIIACIGEGLSDRQNLLTKKIVKTQLETIIFSVPRQSWDQVVIAYEPIWAIGTGKVASPKEVQEIHGFIRELLSTAVSPEMSRSVRILYGGSVTGKTAREIYQMPDVNGFLVGGASLSDDFMKIIHATGR